MKTKAGATIIVISFFGALNLYWLMFAIPLFIVGAILIWLGQNDLKTKLVWTIAPVVLWYPCLMLFIYLSGVIGKANAQKFDFIFNQDFKGRVVVIGNIPCGQDVALKDGREQIYVPDHGVILYQGKVELGYVNHRYFRRTNDGKLVELPKRAKHMFWKSEQNPPPTEETGVWLWGSSSVSNFKEPAIEYLEIRLTVSSKDSLEKFHDFKRSKDFDQMKDSLVRDCTIQSD